MGKFMGHKHPKAPTPQQRSAKALPMPIKLVDKATTG